MRGTTALLIDLENYIRRMNEAAKKGGRAFHIKNEITYLQKLAFDATDGRRLIIQRAYADFRVEIVKRAPNILMDMGIEPVQVYAFGGKPKKNLADRGGLKNSADGGQQKNSADEGEQKNSADVRLIIDVAEMTATAHCPDQFIIVAGDADYIPLIMDLRRRGAEVVVFAPEGGAAKRLQYHCDKYFTFKEGRAVPGMDQGAMRTDFITYLTMLKKLKEEVPEIHLMPKGKWEVFRTRAFQCSANQPPFLLSDLESRIRDSCPNGEGELTSEEIRGGLSQMLESDCFQLDSPMAGPTQKVNWEKDKLILDPAIGSWKALHRRVCDWLIKWYVRKGYDQRLAELALESGGLILR
jgi:uncharacterized LabA/DUF88 family protein